MRNETYHPTADDMADNLAGDVAAAQWDQSQEDARELAYYERLAFSNPEDDTTRQAQAWLAKRQQLITDAA